jgi:hypothetical protein
VQRLCAAVLVVAVSFGQLAFLLSHACNGRTRRLRSTLAHRPHPIPIRTPPMKSLLRPFLVLALLAAALPATAAAPAASAPAAAAAASAPAAAPTAPPRVAKPEKRPATPEEKRDSGTEPGDLRPESRVVPQVNVPLTPSGAGKATYVPPQRGKPAQHGDVDDSAARCNAIADATARKECLDKLR